MTEASSSSQSPVPTIDPIDHLPLQLLRSDIIPPAPTRSKSTIDWLPNFSGYSWVAYGASSLLVISHFPSPLSSEETLIGPIFRQVFELSSDQSSAVAAVSWSPESPSFGELAAVAENCIWVFSHDSSSSKGSFCWSQNAVLVQSTKVEEIRWTGSADGIVSCGIEVVLWKKRGKFWEIAWKFKADQPQTLVSATWSIEGPSATATCPSKERIQGSAFNELSKGVLVCQSDGKCEYSKAELCHPLPVSMIQWRPLRGRLSNRDVKHSVRHILLTCCLDGTVRLWSEIDNVKTRKICKDNYDQNSIKRSFCVSAVIEINQALNGTLGSNIVVTWGTEIGGIFKNDGGGQQYFSKEGFEHDMAGKCDWVIGFGPGMLVNFWAIHCLDDIFPLRFPRVTLWRRHELQGLETGYLNEIKSSNFEDRILLDKIILSRNCFSSPPIMCSPIHLLPSNSLVFSSFNVQTSYDTVVNALDKSTTENFLSHSAGSCLSLDGHAGRILQVSIHPYITEVELAASLDSNGLIIFWSLSTISNCILGCPALIPTWELFGKLVTHDSCSKYTSLRWAPSVLKEELVLLMGHARGIDCFIVKICKNEEENIECHYLCTIPFSGHGPYEDGPNNIFTIPLFSTCDETFHDNKFMLLGVWMTGFQALSWEIILHSFDLSESCCACNFDVNNLSEGSMWMFESTFSGKRYFVAINPSSSQLADPYSEDVVTSFSVVCPHSLIRTQQEFTSGTDFCRIYPACILATGCSDGSLKLWKNHPGKPSTIHLPWELVGVIFAHEGPIDAICLSDCGRKIATICNRSHSNTVSTIHIWDSVNLMGAGTFLLEDTLTLDRDVITLNWLTLGTGRLLLGVCMQNELQVYAEKCCGGLTMSSSVNFLETNVWVCVAFARTFSPIYNFFWGPRATSVVVHGSYFSIFSHSLFHANENKQANCFPCNLKENLCDSKGGINESVLSAIFTDSDIGDFKELLIEDSCGYMKSFQPIKINMKENYLSSSLFLASAQLKSEFATKLGFFSILEVVERLTGSLPIYQPEALLMNISSGNWKRAYVALNHLVECLTSDCSPEKRYILPNYGLPEILLSNYLEGLLSNSSNDKGLQWSGDATLITSSSESQRGSFQFSYDSGSASANDMFTSQSTRSELRRFIESLEKLPESAAITNIEKTQILAIIDLLSEVSSLQSSSPYQSLDDPGRRFWVTVRFQQLLFLRKFGRVASVEELRVDSRLIVWAYHSDCQENLFSSIIANEPSWQELRSLGIGFWFTNVPQLRTRIEKLARLQYLKNKNPKDCALLYVALNRLQVLAGLFKISKDEKDKPLVGFLSRNFQDGKNKAAALKNAYVLLGKHQLELAIAFFLLGGDYSSAINICIKNLGDEQLALVICRLVEGRGGQLERHLITKYLHPSSTEKRNYWLASLLEWELGNYYQSYLSMINFSMNPVVEKSALMSNSVPFLDPNIGFYCQMLANKNSLKNAVGEQEAAILARWATLMRATALNRCGLPIEALECLSSSSSMLGVTNQGSTSDGGHINILRNILMPSPRNSNWLSGDVALHLESNAKSDLALQYFSKLIREHPSWLDISPGSIVDCTYSNEYKIQYEKLLENFEHKLYTGLALFEQRFSLPPSCLISMIFLSLCHHGFSFIGYDITNGYSRRDLSQRKSHTVDTFLSYDSWPKPLLKTTEEISFLFSRFFSACCITCSQIHSVSLEKGASLESIPKLLDTWPYQLKGLVSSLWCLKATLRIISGKFDEDLITKPLMILDLIEYCIYFSTAWLQRNSKVLFLMVQPFLITYANEHNPYEADMANLKKLIPEFSALVAQNSAIHDSLNVSECTQEKQGRDVKHLITDDERWKILGACLWQHLSRFIIYKLNSLSDKLEDGFYFRFSSGKFSSRTSTYVNLNSDGLDLPEQIRLVGSSLYGLLKTTLTHISSYHVKQLASFLWLKLDNGLKVATLEWLKESSQPDSETKSQNQDVINLDVVNKKDELLVSEILWDACADPKMISDCFAQEKINLSSFSDYKTIKRWNEIYTNMMGIDETDGISDNECNNKSRSNKAGSPAKGLLQNGHAFLSSRNKDTTSTNMTPFQNPKEIYKRNGELLEALSINSIDQWQAALASNRKGITFFNWEDEMSLIHKSDYVWSEADWPQNGWAGFESTPAPTFVSPGVGLGSKKGAHLGLGGATVGVGSFGRSSRDLTGGRAFGVPGYAGMGASGFGWEVQEEFEDFVDPPATVDNISTRALSSHPLMPFFLVGSSNTHIYLWEFGKDKATATYGVLPAANVPPPYALASVSALQFDHCGQRFASAALDGTVCTWQLEVGGRSNICPTESSLCFNGHASDVTYFSSSGSIIAVAGNSSNGVNVVIWDTLAPATTSRASIICHEGGARSLSVFDNVVGSGSVSPLIVTGGKGGDVGLHDFRYIATGRTKRHRRSDNGEQSSSASLNSDRDHNVNGMLWYIPKAHSGSVTKISTIPNTSLFLTGSKDGDVKLWDSKKAELVFHWSKLHERHTFLQPSSSRFGGVVRAAVTDIQVVSHGFLTCGGDGTVKLVQLKDYHKHEVKL